MKKTIITTFLCISSFIVFDNVAKADYITDYNTSVEDTVFQKSMFNFDLIPETSNYSLPTIDKNISTQNITELDYTAELLSYKKNSQNFLIFYSLDENKIPTELFRIKLEKSGSGKIVNRNLLNKIKPNSTLIMNVMSFDINNGKIENIKYSKTSKEYYTQKTINLIVKEGDKKVVTKQVTLINEPKDGKVLVIPYELEKYHKPDRYYSYTNEKVTVDGQEYNINNLEIPFNAKEIVLDLAKNEEYWQKISVTFPSIYKDKNTEYSIKKNSTIGELVKETKLPNEFEKNSDYTFDGYYIDDKKITQNDTTQIKEGQNIKAVFKTKVILDNGKDKKEVTLLTGQKLSELDTSFFEKEHYDIESYTLYNKENNEKIKDINNLQDETVDNSIVIKANYKEKQHTLSVRQDDYNKRFGRVDSSISDKDFTWSEAKPVGEFLKELRSKIKPSTGYETVFRINKNVVKDSDHITKDAVLEIYFKKNESDWVTVRFNGRGIDKFLSDGQEMLANTRIDTMINLPSSTGETSREFLGWKANDDYLIVGEDSKTKRVSKEKLLQTNELGSVVTEKGKDLEFTAVYREIYKVEFAKTQVGEILLANNNSNILEVNEFNSIGDSTKNNKLIIYPRSGYNLTHFIADKNVKVKIDNGTKEIFAGQKIEEEDIYKIIPTSDLKLTPIFEYSLCPGNLNEMIENNKIKTVEDALTLEFESKEDIRKILGPIYYLR